VSASYLPAPSLDSLRIILGTDCAAAAIMDEQSFIGHLLHYYFSRARLVKTRAIHDSICYDRSGRESPAMQLCVSCSQCGLSSRAARPQTLRAMCRTSMVRGTSGRCARVRCLRVRPADDRQAGVRNSHSNFLLAWAFCHAVVFAMYGCRKGLWAAAEGLFEHKESAQSVPASPTASPFA
jgi:hypothetical protein